MKERGRKSLREGEPAFYVGLLSRLAVPPLEFTASYSLDDYAIRRYQNRSVWSHSP